MDASTEWLVNVAYSYLHVYVCLYVHVLGHENLFQFRVVANKRFDYRIHENNKQV